jgi:hypothetical protein
MFVGMFSDAALYEHFEIKCVHSPSFVDRDMLMRYHWGLGIGHVYAHDIVANGVTDGSLSKSTAEEPVILAGLDVELETQGSAPEPLHVCPTDDADGSDDSDDPELGMENRDDDNWDSDDDGDEELEEDPYGSDEDTFLSREEMYGQDFDLY